MKTKTIFKTLALAMLMPAMLLTTACSSSDDDPIINNENINNENTAKKGFTIPVTVNVTRQGDAATTRATYNGSTLSFSSGDKLFVWGYNNDGNFAGTLEWQSGGTFSGTITTQKKYSDTAETLLSQSDSYAVLLPNGYESYDFFFFEGDGYNSTIYGDYTKAFADSKAAAVAQFSYEYAEGYSSGFALAPKSAILNFTITGLTASTDVNVVLTGGGEINFNKTVTTDGSGNATFAIGVDHYSYLENFSLTVGGKAITLTSGSKTLYAGHVYNITRTPGLLSGKFTINSSGKQVRFSQGNLQAVCASADNKGSTEESWTWKFATNQWDFVGDAAANNAINGNGSVSSAGTVDLFGWVGASSSFTGAAMYGISNSTNRGSYSNIADDPLKSDWGNTIGSGWRTLTKDEWVYLFNTRSGSTVNGTSNARYTYATINTDGTSVEGLILFPDGLTIAGNEATWGKINGMNTKTECTSAQWTALEGKGCVFLPFAGYRIPGTGVCGLDPATRGTINFYWSSSPVTYRVDDAFSVCIKNDFSGKGFEVPGTTYRNYGGSVRLVRDVE